MIDDDLPGMIDEVLQRFGKLSQDAG